MGFFSNLWDGAKSLAGKALGGAKWVAGKASGVFDTVKNVAGKISNIPIIGNIVKNLVDNNPRLAVIRDAFNTADGIVQGANKFLNPQPVHPIDRPD